jgi:hypothetical protein
MRILIAIFSCARDISNGFNQAIRDTWARNAQGADIRFFVGRTAIPKRDDEICLDAPDEWITLPHKTKAIQCWAVDHDYDFTYKCDTDTYVRVPRLLASGFEAYDYTGFFGPYELGNPCALPGNHYASASGGAGYCLSRKASRMVASAKVDDWSEDRWVGKILGPKIRAGEIAVCNSTRYGGFDGISFATDISCHYCSETKSRPFNVTWMYKQHKVNGVTV